MRNAIFDVAIIVFVISPIVLIITMAIPTWINKRIRRNFTRWQYAKYIGVALALTFVTMMFTAPPSPKVEQSITTPSSSPEITTSDVTDTQITMSPLPSDDTQPADRQTAKVTRIIDGDTIELEGGKRVRYIGIDTPEMSPVECYARQSYDKNSKLVLGKIVELEKDVSETDRYGRLLRYLWIDGQLINEILVAQGYARSSSYPPDVKYQDKFKLAETKARDDNNGLWGDVCSSPTSTPKPTTTPQTTKQSTPTPTPTAVTGGAGWSCDCSKTCTEISSCGEAQYQLKNCGCKARDNDGDGIACDGAPLRCQN